MTTKLNESLLGKIPKEADEYPSISREPTLIQQRSRLSLDSLDSRVSIVLAGGIEKLETLQLALEQQISQSQSQFEKLATLISQAGRAPDSQDSRLPRAWS